MAFNSKAAVSLQEPLDDLILKKIESSRENGKGLSRNQIAREIGITPSALSAYCKSEKEAGIGALLKIAEYFNVDSDFLLGRQPTEKAENRDIFNATGLKDDAIAILEHFVNKKSNINNMPIKEDAITTAKIMVLNNLVSDPSFADMMDMVVKMVFLKIISGIAPNTQAYRAIKDEKNYDDGSMVLTPEGSFEFYENTIMTIFKREINRAINETITKLK